MNVRIRINGNTVVVSNTALKSATVDLRQQRLDDSAIQSLRRMLATEIGDAALRYSEKKVLEEVSKRVAARRWTQISLDPTPLLGHSGGGEAAKPVAPPPSQNKGGSSGANAKDGSGTGSGGASEIWHSGYYPVVWTNKNYKMMVLCYINDTLSP